ncbi:MAG: hypothetical protein JWM91_2810 [Rhodospirillales bacterium]|nr:hypothetical protein [Rhodospirillales bacterium]
MSSPVIIEEFPDLESHKRMWSGFTHLLVRSIIGLVVLMLFIGFITGVL